MSSISIQYKYAKESKKESKEKYIPPLQYKLYYERKKYYMSVIKNKEYILLKIGEYEIRLTIEGLTSVSKLVFDSIDELYDYIKDILSERSVDIKNIIQNKFIVLSFVNNINGKKKEYTISLIYKNENKDNIINSLNNKLESLSKSFLQLKNDFNLLRSESRKMKNEIISLRARQKNGTFKIVSRSINFKINNFKKNPEVENGHKKNDEVNISRNIIRIPNNNYLKSKEEKKSNTHKNSIDRVNTLDLKKILDMKKNIDRIKNNDKSSTEIKKSFDRKNSKNIKKSI